jgi:hypothetical protein
MPDRPKHYQWHEHDVEDQDSTRPFEPSGIELKRLRQPAPDFTAVDGPFLACCTGHGHPSLTAWA